MLTTEGIPTLSIELQDGATESALLRALAMASFSLADPLECEGEIHPAYADPDGLTAVQADEFITGNRIVMLFAKGRVCLSHLVVDHQGLRRYAVRFEMYDGSPYMLVRTAQDILDSLTARRADGGSTDIDCDADPDGGITDPVPAPSAR